jgi:hypothetical protein
MSFCTRYYSGFTLALLAAGELLVQADDSAKGRPAPIIFSAPKSDTVSSNLNQMGTKSSSLRDLESGLKKPFEIFDNGRSSGGFQPPNQFTSPTPPPITRKMKDAMDKRAEESYLLSEDDEARPGAMTSDRESLDPITGRPKTSLDRYYDRIDRLRTGLTNQTSGGLDLLGEKDGANAKNASKLRTSTSLFDSELSPNAYVSGGRSNSISEGGRLSSERLKPRSYGDAFELGPVESAQQAGRKGTRLDDFKRLLDGPGYGARNGFNATPPALSSPYDLPKPTGVPSPGSSVSPGSQPSRGSYANTPGFSGTVGVPSGVPEYAASSPSLTITPSIQQPQQPAQQPPVPSFKLPRGRF